MYCNSIFLLFPGANGVRSIVLIVVSRSHYGNAPKQRKLAVLNRCNWIPLAAQWIYQTAWRKPIGDEARVFSNIGLLCVTLLLLRVHLLVGVIFLV